MAVAAAVADVVAAATVPVVAAFAESVMLLLIVLCSLLACVPIIVTIKYASFNSLHTNVHVHYTYTSIIPDPKSHQMIGYPFINSLTNSNNVILLIQLLIIT